MEKCVLHNIFSFAAIPYHPSSYSEHQPGVAMKKDLQSAGIV
jgi:hypothetical protein